MKKLLTVLLSIIFLSSCTYGEKRNIDNPVTPSNLQNNENLIDDDQLLKVSDENVIIDTNSDLEITGKVCETDDEVDENKCEGNYVWGAAMNFAWNELKDNIVKENILLDTINKDTLELSNKLNNTIITNEILDEESYYIKSGYGQETLNKINVESKIKFPKKTFKKLNFFLENHDIISYAYFFKEVEYKEPFNESTVYFKGEKYKGFKSENESQRNNIKILDYKDDDNFIVKLDLKDNNDELILLKGYNIDFPEDGVELVNTYNNGNLDSLEFNDSYHDFFQAPNIKLNYHRNYNVMTNKILSNEVLVKQCRKNNLPDDCYVISKMFENIKFYMDNKGARVENEATIGTNESVDISEYKIRKFHLDEDYWIFMKRKNSEIPYFILGVKNGNLMSEE